MEDLTRQATRPKGVENDAYVRLPNISLPHVTLTFDLLTHKVDRFIHSGPCTTRASWHQNWLVSFHDIVFTNLIITDK